MDYDFSKKSTVDEIRKRFDQDVERFSNLDTGQAATMDAPLAMELLTQAARASTPHARAVLDIGAGAGNNTLRLLQLMPDLECHLVDLSEPMLQRAKQRLKAAGANKVHLYHGDWRDVAIAKRSVDIVLAAAVLHHLRDTDDWENAFRKIYDVLRPGGSFWVSDMVTHEGSAVSHMMTQRYADYLTELGGKEYQQKVFAYIEREDTPRSLTFQLSLLEKVGFRQVDVLHKNGCFATFGGTKPLD